MTSPRPTAFASRIDAGSRLQNTSPGRATVSRRRISF